VHGIQRSAQQQQQQQQQQASRQHLPFAGCSEHGIQRCAAAAAWIRNHKQQRQPRRNMAGPKALLVQPLILGQLRRLYSLYTTQHAC
jgi:hypothetical protein